MGKSSVPQTRPQLELSPSCWLHSFYDLSREGLPGPLTLFHCNFPSAPLGVLCGDRRPVPHLQVVRSVFSKTA